MCVVRCGARTDGGIVQLLEDVALVLVVGNVEALLREQTRDAIGVKVRLLQERRHAVSVSRRWCSACLVDGVSALCGRPGANAAGTHSLDKRRDGGGPSCERA